MAIDLTQYKFASTDGSEKSIADHKGKVVLIVNVASHCGFTPQYEGLQKLFDRFQSRGFVILGFPCNQFGFQEPGSESDIQSFCSTTYSVKFPVLPKIKVNGGSAHPIYDDLKSESPGLLSKGPIAWNFTKFLLDRQGRVVKRFGPRTEPDALADEIEKLL